ncbi:MAG: 23S rRNA (uracil(1939)-C(5))-methyltransferase RlmD [Oscillospiraceae bacterium]|nr:23S rRNA (uracil(1939)-C(5))-methyltransferase RlmD [Oscillospiraceae bacterium]
MSMLKEGQVYPAVIEGYASGGEGVARVEGMAVFVKGALRGERVEVLIEHVGHSAAWGHIEKLLETSPSRIEPDCPYFGACGGCQFRHMAYEEELEAKRQRVEDALRRIGGVDVSVSVIHGAENTQRYRNKVQFPVAAGAIGYYAGRTHKVVDIADCLLQPELDTVCRTAVKGWMERFHVPAYDERTGKGLIRHLFLRTNSTGEVLCCLVANGKSLPHGDELVDALRTAAPTLAGVVLSVNTRKTNVILGGEFRTLWGRDWLEEKLCGHSFRLSVPSFFQVNRAQTEILYRRALDFAALTGSETVVELYCGIGTISLTLAERAKRVIGVEVVPQAVKDAKENARRNGLEGKTHFECGDAGDLAAKLEQEGVRPDVVVVDPPRKGLASEVVDTVAKMAPDRVVYVSCDPATLARDVKRFGALGYVPTRAEAVDLFPRTAHVETVALLSCKPSQSCHYK